MKKNYWIWLGVVFLVVGLGACNPQSASNDEQVEIPQLASEQRENAETMVLVDAPPVMPPDHAKFWSNMDDYTGCMTCHGNEETGAPQPSPSQHYVGEDAAKGVFRDPQCIQCHATQPYLSSSVGEEK